MRYTTSIVAAVLALGASANQNYLGFNSGSTFADRSAKFEADFAAEFTAAQNLEGAPGKFNAVRLYTNIQAGSTNDPIEAFQAAIKTKTYLLLGVWASGTDNINNELSALNKAVELHGSKLADLVIGISIGSEDLYRNSVTGNKNKAGVGNSPETLVRFINDARKALSGGPLAKIPVGHVDTWDVWPNATNKPVLDAVDFIGVDEYPFYEDGKGNTIDNAANLFTKAYEATLAAANGKPVWVTETGWPASGPDWDLAVANTTNAEIFWQEVGCRKLFNKTPTFWYTLRDSNPDNEVKFAITKDLSTKPLFNLTCAATEEVKSRSSEEAPESSTSMPSGTGLATGTVRPTPSSGSRSNNTQTDAASGTGGSRVSATTSGTAAASSGPSSAAAAPLERFSMYAGALAAVGMVAQLL